MHRAGMFFIVGAGLLGLALLLPRPAVAWPDNPNVNVPLSIATGNQMEPITAADGAGGAIVTWTDTRNGNSDIYAQRISADGTPLWAGNGVAVCANTSDQQEPRIISDGAGGAIVTWFDWRNGNYDIYAQHISAAGTPLWPVNGVAVCANTSEQQGATIAPDGVAPGEAGSGAIIAWIDYRNGNTDIYAQHISGAGTVQWPADGVAVCTFTGNQQFPLIVSDSTDGAIVVWTDNRDGPDYAYIYAQRISATGTVNWTTDGVAVCTAASQKASPTITTDDSSGVIVTWEDFRNGTYDIYAQRIPSDGMARWTPDGVALCTATGTQTMSAIAPDDSGGAIVAWRDGRGDFFDIYAQRISAGGTVQWTANGVVLSTATDDHSAPTIAPDGASGAIVTWWDERSGNGTSNIYAQRVSGDGTPLWTANGEAICTLASSQYYPTIASDGAGGAIVTWQDERSGNWDIYAQRIWADGTTPVLLSFASFEVSANCINLTWLASGIESAVAAVYRSSVGGEWLRIGEAAVDGSGYLRYIDPIDAAAIRVGYRLGIIEAGIESFHGETWVDLPARGAALMFALEPVRPNPSSGGALTVRFTLPGAAAASLELLDVAGRRIAAREVGSLGTGQHTLDLGAGRNLAPGLYLVRLTQGTNTRVARVAMLR